MIGVGAALWKSSLSAPSAAAAISPGDFAACAGGKGGRDVENDVEEVDAVEVDTEGDANVDDRERTCDEEEEVEVEDLRGGRGAVAVDVAEASLFNEAVAAVTAEEGAGVAVVCFAPRFIADVTTDRLARKVSLRVDVALTAATRAAGGVTW